MDSTYGNSIFPENYIDIYMKAYNEEGKLKPVIESDEIEIIDDYIKKLEDDFKSGIKFV